MIYLNNLAKSPLYNKEALADSFNKELSLPTLTKTTADLLNLQEDEVFFTSGAEESNNWIISKTAARFLHMGKIPHFITTGNESSSVLRAMEQSGAEVTVLPVKDGEISLADLESAIKDNTKLISISAVDPVFAKKRDIKAIAKLAHSRQGIVFHCDLSLLLGRDELNLDCIDAATLSPKHIGAPTGIGVFILKRGNILPALIEGDKLQHLKRAGELCLPLIDNFNLILEEKRKNLAENRKTVYNLLDLAEREISKIENCSIIGIDKSLGLCHLSFDKISGEGLKLMLEQEEIFVGKIHSSLADSINHGSIYISANENNTESDIITACRMIEKYNRLLLEMSPFSYEEDL